MPDLSMLSIIIRPCVLFSSTIIGFARVSIDKRILLKEITIFHSEGQVKPLMDRFPVGMCPVDMDRKMINDIVWSLREVIEMAVAEEWKKQQTGTEN